jgi:hypothetical protein
MRRKHFTFRRNISKEQCDNIALSGINRLQGGATLVTTHSRIETAMCLLDKSYEFVKSCGDFVHILKFCDETPQTGTNDAKWGCPTWSPLSIPSITPSDAEIRIYAQL